MLPQYERLGQPRSSKYLFQFQFGTMALVTVSLPFFGFCFCVIWSIVYFFERSTDTHCGVNNYLPSISAAIGNYQPQRFVWQLAILLAALPRLLIALQYSRHFDMIIRRNRRPIAYVASLFNIVENCALVGLSLWTSTDDYEIHKSCFLIFIATSEIYMVTSIFLFKNGRKFNNDLTPIERKSLRFKRNLFAINLTSFCLAGYFFIRHNSYCEAGVYTVFALLEYIVVLTNMGFHSTAYWDFCDKSVVCDCANGFYMIDLASASNYGRLL